MRDIEDSELASVPECGSRGPDPGRKTRPIVAFPVRFKLERRALLNFDANEPAVTSSDTKIRIDWECAVTGVYGCPDHGPESALLDEERYLHCRWKDSTESRAEPSMEGIKGQGDCIPCIRGIYAVLSKSRIDPTH